jgi:hypothetical protein
MTGQALPLEPWHPRAVQPLGLWTAGERTLKAYGMRGDAAVPLPSHLIEAAQALLQQTTLTVAGRANTSFGFAVLHRGDEAVWLLLHWWLDGGICAQRLLRASHQEPLAFVEQDRPLMACVWELAVIDHERRAWTRTAMNPASTPEAYLRDWMEEGLC